MPEDIRGKRRFRKFPKVTETQKVKKKEKEKKKRQDLVKSEGFIL